MQRTIARPDATEHAPFALTYVTATAKSLSESGLNDVRELMAKQCDTLETLVANVSDSNANKAYAPGKWSLKESILHMCDSERVFAYRAMRIARGDATPLPGFDQDTYVPKSVANARTLADILAEFRAVRGASLALVNSLDDDAIAREGTTNNNRVTVRALCWLIPGHAAHHIDLTRDRYLPALS